MKVVIHVHFLSGRYINAEAWKSLSRAQGHMSNLKGGQPQEKGESQVSCWYSFLAPRTGSS
jgi:hypothetical protein